MAHVLKIHTVLSDGNPNPSPELEIVIKHPDTGEPMPEVVVRATAKTQAEWRRIRREHEVPVRHPQTRAMEMLVDADAALDALLVASIQSWRGIVGYDLKPLALCPATVAALDYRTKVQLQGAILGAEVVETTEASFREPA